MTFITKNTGMKGESLCLLQTLKRWIPLKQGISDVKLIFTGIAGY